MSVSHGEQIREAEAHGEQQGRSLEWWGMIFFIASEALIFANLIAAYLYLEIRNGNWQLPTELVFPLINTVILLGSSVPARIAGAAIAKGNRGRMQGFLLLTIIMGLWFLGGQIYEYSGLFGQHFTPQASVFGSSFFTLTGFHGLHVTVGALFLIIVLLRSLRGDFSAKKHFAVQAAEMYWHFVDGVWIVVFSLVYLLPLLGVFHS
ncbi:MAG TPA: heme-copper oxidase subunit III [Ktedonobacteraceae bacterium]|jgi:heme/copper-type cytochrome/quinol oxidase subunit 3|nr:heme-copper oxidase subunit III [Ktedonobacteraceae bacterium]